MSIAEKMSVQPFLIAYTDDDSKSSMPELVFEDQAIVDYGDIENIRDHKQRIIEGFANLPIIDRVGDLVDPMAFKNSLPVFMTNPIVRLNHSKGEVVGRVMKAKITEKGLWIRVKIGYDTPKADEVWKLIVQKMLRGFSVYGRIVQKTPKQNMEGKQYQHVTEFELQEIGIVDIPANQDSLFAITKKSVDETMENEIVQPDNQTATEEVGNETVHSDAKVEKALASIVDFQQKTNELLVNLLESNVTMAQKLAEMSNIAAKGADDMDADGYDDEYDEDFDEEYEKSLSEVKDLKKQVSDLETNKAELEEKIKYKGMQDEIESLKAKLSDLTKEGVAPETEEVPEETPVDIDTEEAVRKAVAKSAEPIEEPEEEEDRLTNWMAHNLK